MVMEYIDRVYTYVCDIIRQATMYYFWITRIPFHCMFYEKEKPRAELKFVHTDNSSF